MNNISLYYFTVVAEELNITRAAEKLFISQQALSEHIRKLEKQYNTTLLQRGPRLSLTYQGEQMLAYARRVLEAETHLVESIRDSSEFRSMRLPIGLSSARALVFLPSLICNYAKIHPNVMVSVTSGNHEFIENQLRLGKIELYLGMLDSVKYYGESEVLYQDQLYFICQTSLLEQKLGSKAKSFIRSHSDGIALHETAAFPIALPTLQSSLRITFERMYSEAGIIPNCVLETIDHDLLFDVCQTGLCCAFVSRELLCRKLMHKSFPPDMIFIPALNFDHLAYYGLITDKHTPSVYTADFIRCCKETVGEMIGGIDSYLDSLNRKYLGNGFE